MTIEVSCADCGATSGPQSDGPVDLVKVKHAPDCEGIKRKNRPLECGLEGHRLRIVEEFGGEPVRIICLVCPKSWSVTTSD